MKLIKLGTVVRDNATKLDGMLTHANFDSAHQLLYCFQPRGLNPETGAPIKGMWLAMSRLSGYGPKNLIEVDPPLGVIGTEVTDDASGFSGVVTGLTMHISMCVHVDVTAPGTVKGELIPVQDFDIRRVSGSHPLIKKLNEMTDEERAASMKQHPSPASTPLKPR